MMNVNIPPKPTSLPPPPFLLANNPAHIGNNTNIISTQGKQLQQTPNLTNTNNVTAGDPTIMNAIAARQEQHLQQQKNFDRRRVVFKFEPHLRRQFNLGMNPDRPTCEYWLQSNGRSCPNGNDCPFKHPSKIFKNKIVCKYWLRGLCKMGDDCDFLHEYNLSKMPECAYYAANGVCTQSPECIYLHVDPQSKIAECWNYSNMGFCPDGPSCTKRHIRKVICDLYLTGFCPKGKECELAHPKFKLGLLHGRFKIVTDEEIIQKRLEVLKKEGNQQGETKDEIKTDNTKEKSEEIGDAEMDYEQKQESSNAKELEPK